MNRDATPSWSGYIFQGEVALCKTLETINELEDEDIPDRYCLKLEEDEDFSLITNDFEVFQVKAYLSNGSNKLNAYKDVVEELIDRYYYTITEISDPQDGRKIIKSYSLEPRENPIKATLITSESIDDIDETFSTYHKRYSDIDKSYFKIIHGQYKIDNITTKLNNAIRALFPDLQDSDIDVKRCHCCSEITKMIYDRHRTKKTKSISFKTIKDWLVNSPNAFTEKICWHEISKIFFHSLSEDLGQYDLNDENQNTIYNKINDCLVELNCLDTSEMKNLLESYLTPHKKLNKDNLRLSFGSYIDAEVVKQVILKAIKKIKTNPIYKRLQYVKKEANNMLRYQLLVHNNQFDEEDPIENRNFQKHCEEIYKQPVTQDIDYFITSNLNKEKEEIKNRLIEILDIDSNLEERVFGFRKIDNAITEINDENIN
uniref:ABC-three component system protein n=1 Tax=uncultured Dysgonomonas sp. TaxID=206096 RepID=UPI0026209ED3|nr:ABC-three component system protein [uncultured Dysgonomonas sp.]